MPPTNELDQRATVVITHRVREGRHADYEAWLGQITPVCKSYPGHLGMQVIRPVAGVSTTYTIVIRFDSHDHLTAWTGSADRQRLIEVARPLLVEDDKFYVLSGLDFWFTPEGAHARLPVRWKQALLTWSAIAPLALLIPWLLHPLYVRLGLGEHSPVKTLIGTGCMVGLMVYLIMPRYTKLAHKWLFR